MGEQSRRYRLLREFGPIAPAPAGPQASAPQSKAARFKISATTRERRPDHAFKRATAHDALRENFFMPRKG
jgi:hypothetical protein